VGGRLRVAVALAVAASSGCFTLENLGEIGRDLTARRKVHVVKDVSASFPDADGVVVLRAVTVANGMFITYPDGRGARQARAGAASHVA
jgi:hypothetical protein